MALYQDVIIAGFGGQGVMLIGNLLAYAGMNSGLNVTYIPVYGPEMRGGTANCTVVISDEDIGSPIIQTPKSLILMNQPSADKFLPRMEKGGLAVLNTSLVDMPANADGVHLLGVAASGALWGAGVARAAGVGLDGRRFTPHVTLERLRPGSPEATRLAAAVAARSGLVLPPVPVEDFRLYSSRLRPGGSVYEELARYPLG